MLIPSIIAPFLGIAFAFTLILGITWIVAKRAPTKVNRVFRRLQLVSGGFVAFTHGTNDAQKTMGIIALALVASGHLSPDFERPPTWVIASSALAMGAGTYAGGWRIIRTLGQRIAKIDPPQGFAAQTACASILWGTAHFGFPVSTTQTISGSVLGAGAIRGFSAVRWGVAGNIVVAWILTLPASALVGAAHGVRDAAPGRPRDRVHPRDPDRRDRVRRPALGDAQAGPGARDVGSSRRYAASRSMPSSTRARYTGRGERRYSTTAVAFFAHGTSVFQPATCDG